MSTEPITTAMATPAAQDSSERNLLIALLLIVLVGVGAMFFITA